MAILKNRPLFSACLLYIICVFCARFSSPAVKISVMIASGVLLIFCVVLCLCKRISKRVLLCFAVGLLCAAVAFAGAYLAFDLGQQPYKSIAERESCEVQATVLERHGSDGMTVYRIRVHELDGQRKAFDAELVCEFNASLQMGDKFTATSAPSTYDQLNTLYANQNDALAQGLRLRFTSVEEWQIEQVAEHSRLPSVALHKLNNALCRELLNLCENQSGGLACALLLGNKGFLADTLSRDFERAGASHMLALSGMHVSILIGALGLLLGKLRVHRKVRALLLVAASVGYLQLTGMSVSALRAVAMMCMLQLSYLLASDHDTLTALGLVGAVILLLDPYSACDTGFILSFLATFGIVVLVPPLHAYLKERSEQICKPPHAKVKRRLVGFGSAVLETMLIGVIATFAIMVPSCFLIGHVSLFSPLTTLLISPLVSAMLVLGAGALLFCFIPPIANLFGTLIRLLYALMLPYVEGISAVDGALIPLSHTAVQLLCILFCCIMLLLLILPLRKKLLLSLPPLLLACSLCIFFPISAALEQDELHAAYTHPSSVSEAIVAADGYRAYLCDLSSGSGNAMHHAMHAASQMHATEIGALLLTDYHTAQSAHVTDLLCSYKTDLIYMPVTTDQDELAVQAGLCEIAERYGTHVAFYEYGSAVEWFEGSMLTVHRTELSRSEQPVLIVTLQKGDACLSTVCASAAWGELADQMDSAVRNADTIVIPERGPKPRLTYSLDGCLGADVVFATRTLAAFCDPQSLGGARSMTVCPEIVYFTLESQEDP